MDLDKANITSVLALLFAIVAGYFGANELVKNYLVSLAGPLAGIVVWYFTEKHNSTLISGDAGCCCGSECVDEDLDGC